MFEKLRFDFAAKGFIRHFGQKMATLEKKMKTSQTLYTSSLVYLESFWLRNMYLKTTFSVYISPLTQKKAQLTLGATRPKIKRIFSFLHLNSMLLHNIIFWVEDGMNCFSDQKPMRVI